MVKTDMKIFFESNRPFNPIVDPEIKITFHNVSSIQYEQLRLNDNFWQYLETILALENAFRMDIQNSPPQKSYEMVIGSQSFPVDLRAAK